MTTEEIATFKQIVAKALDQQWEEQKAKHPRQEPPNQALAYKCYWELIEAVIKAHGHLPFPLFVAAFAASKDVLNKGAFLLYHETTRKS